VVNDIEAETRRMLDFLSLPRDESCLKFHETERPIRTASANQVRQPLYKSSSGRWRAHAARLKPLLAALEVPETRVFLAAELGNVGSDAAALASSRTNVSRKS
jgi:hypothetical protein